MIIVNGKEINLTEDTTDTMLKDGDRLEVVTFVGGG